MVRDEMTHTPDSGVSDDPIAEDASSRFFSIKRTAGMSSMTTFVAIAVIGLLVALMATYLFSRRSRIQAEAKLVMGEDREQRLNEAHLDTDLAATRQRPAVEASQSRPVKYDPKISQAQGECRSIGDAIKLFWRDVGEWPMRNGPSKSSRVDYLYFAGQRPRFKGTVRTSWGFKSGDIRNLLVKNGGGGAPWFKTADANVQSGSFGWRGPYLRTEKADPWGRSYLISVCGFPGGTKPDNNVWCLSAGPNGVIDTPTSAENVEGDDIGVWVR